jgi:hypothetical protein
VFSGIFRRGLNEMPSNPIEDDDKGRLNTAARFPGHSHGTGGVEVQASANFCENSKGCSK